MQFEFNKAAQAIIPRELNFVSTIRVRDNFIYSKGNI